METTNGETMETVRDFIWGGGPKLQQMAIAAMKLKDLLLGRKAMSNLDSILKKQTLLCQQRSI